MSKQESVSLANPPHHSDDKLFRQDLDACIEAIENFHFTNCPDLIGPHVPLLSPVEVIVTPPALVDPTASLPSPPQSPQRQPLPSPDLASPPATAIMDRSSHSGAVRGHAGLPSVHRPLQDARSSQDARSNLAVQPAANAGTFKLKKNAVRIVGAAGPSPSLKASVHAAASTPPPAAQPSLTPFPPVVEKADWLATKENEQPQVPQLDAKPASSPPVVKLLPKKIELPSPNHNSSLDDMFARLSAASTPTPSRPATELSLAGPDKSLFSFEDRANTTPAASNVSATVSSKDLPESVKSPARSDSERVQNEPALVQSSSSTTSWQGELQNAHEAEYLRKAREYFCALPSQPATTSHMVKTVANNLSAAYVPKKTNLQPEDVERLSARYIFAVITYVNKKVKLNPKPLTTDLVKKVLLDSEGDFLQLCAALVKDKYISLDNIEQVAQLCQNMVDVLPKAVVGVNNDAPAKVANSVPAAADTSTKTLGVSSEEMKTWPAQEKREHGAIHRGCVLKGVSGVKSLNQLQALVWGGRLESISMPATGSEHAVVTFLTPEACQTYLDATENGIEVQGGTKSTVVFVDKQPGPNSINDVIQNCIDGDASRCIRATGADDDWSDGALFMLARGKQQIPRDVDRIKQGKTARGHHYIEFRFGNIYHALNFKRHLMSDEEWEHCSISYAPDPCELADGVHYED